MKIKQWRTVWISGEKAEEIWWSSLKEKKKQNPKSINQSNKLCQRSRGQGNHHWFPRMCPSFGAFPPWIWATAALKWGIPGSQEAADQATWPSSVEHQEPARNGQVSITTFVSLHLPGLLDSPSHGWRLEGKMWLPGFQPRWRARELAGWAWSSFHCSMPCTSEGLRALLS